MITTKAVLIGASLLGALAISLITEHTSLAGVISGCILVCVLLYLSSIGGDKEAWDGGLEEARTEVMGEGK